ncbi:hypothetical protein OF829_07490 [Sphingomonas sp. LB-2]|uniref:hypothetical protein n=1 Tax=Sphingomonas caeni TaxID=2984949 RepID=UPI00222E09C6|nr:hypothetical protein [Sphingomonas caeni]MCW3847078.1 hypothetical protein [Sphingomonas caeni]
MKLIYAAAAAVACLVPGAAFAQTGPAPASAPVAAAPAVAAKFNLDTPIETLAADEKAKAVLTADLPDLLPHPMYEQFKGMSLRQLQPMSQGALSDELMKKVETDLAAIK